MHMSRLRVVASASVVVVLLGLACSRISSSGAVRSDAQFGHSQPLRRMRVSPEKPPALMAQSVTVLPIAFEWQSSTSKSPAKRTPVSVRDRRIAAIPSPPEQRLDLVLAAKFGPEYVEIRSTTSARLIDLETASPAMLCRYPCGAETKQGWALPSVRVPSGTNTLVLVALYSSPQIVGGLLMNKVSYVLRFQH